ncbi:hypothetical protein F5884DRAFT_114550 [Xylogone sp. PMI_703]|nr:hypothetical protein F5884DRAFT_114550 [Xylogone sp. PMI_703]
MHASISKTAALLAVGLPLTHAFDRIRFPSTVTAGKPTTLTIANDLADGAESFDAGFDSFRVYLATTPPGWGTGPVCYLVNSSSIDTTSLQVTIPDNVGPSGSFYSIAVMEFNQDPNMDGPSGFEYSSDFTLTGGTGEWSAAELNGTAFGDGDIIPCTAYNCVRQCTEGVDVEAAQEDMDLAKQAYECMAKCPGIDVPSWDEITSEDGGDYSSSSEEGDDSEDAGSTVTVGGSTVVVTASSAPTHSTLTTAKTPSSATAKQTPSAAPSQTPSASVSQSPSPTSNSTVPVVSPNAGSQVAAGVPLLFSLFAGILLM